MKRVDKWLMNLAEILSLNSDYTKEAVFFALKMWSRIILQSGILVFISVLIGKPSYFFKFFLIFFPMRMLFEGYHCQTYKKCIINSTFLFVLICYITEAANANIAITKVLTILQFFSFVYFICLSIYKHLNSLKTAYTSLVIRVGFLILVFVYSFNGIGLQSTLAIKNNICACTWFSVFILTIINRN